MKSLFGTCHTVRKFNNELLGDEIDLSMYEFSNFVKSISDNKGRDIY